MRRCVIVGGADIGDYERVSAYVGEDDYVIYCDSGLKHRANLHRQPNLIVGDFDSHENPNLDIETVVTFRALLGVSASKMHNILCIMQRFTRDTSTE